MVYISVWGILCLEVMELYSLYVYIYIFCSCFFRSILMACQSVGGILCLEVRELYSLYVNSYIFGVVVY